jgi:hypothetical protein
MEKFYFDGFDPTPALQRRADRLYEKILEAAPSDAQVNALLEWDGKTYHCSVEIGSSSLPFAVGTAHPNPSIALDKAELSMMRKIEKWKSVRFQGDHAYDRELSKATG